MSSKKVRRVALGVALMATALAAHADGLAAGASGSLVPFAPADGSSYMEVWGVGSTSRYANPATDPGDPFHDLIAAAETSTQARAAGYAFATANWSFDPSAAPTSISASGNSGRYPMGALQVGLSGFSGSAAYSAVDTQLAVSRSSSHHTQIVSFHYALPTVDGPLPGSTSSFGVPGGGTTTVDLVSLLGPTAYTANGFDLSAFSTLPVRLTAPTEMRPVYIGVDFNRFNSAADFGITPPATLSLADFDFANIAVAFDGVYGVSVDATDYASNDAFVTARDWVQANVRQVNYEAYVSWQVVQLQTAPVPEPGALPLWLLGAAALLVLRRRG